MFPCRQTRAQAHGGSELLAKTCHVAVLAGLIAFAACFPGCDRSDPFFSSDGPSQLSLRQTFDYLRQCRLAGDYSALRPHIDPGGRDGVVDLLVAVVELMLANTAALEAMKRSCPDVEVQPYDLSFFQNKLELLSRDVEWIEAASKAKGGSGGPGWQSFAPGPLQFELNRESGNTCPAPTARRSSRPSATTRSLHQIESALSRRTGPGQIAASTDPHGLCLRRVQRVGRVPQVRGRRAAGPLSAKRNPTGCGRADDHSSRHEDLKRWGQPPGALEKTEPPTGIGGFGPCPPTEACGLLQLVAGDLQDELVDSERKVRRPRIANSFSSPADAPR